MEAMTGSLVLVGAHADDIELHAGGIATAWAQRGRSVHFVLTTNNMSGNLLPEGQPDGKPHRLGPRETQAVRQREQNAAAALIGASVHHLNYPQRHYWNGHEQVSLDFTQVKHDAFLTGEKPPLIIAAQNDQAIGAVGELLVKLKPALIITQTITDIDPEHHATASLVWQACLGRENDLPGTSLMFWAPGTTSMAGMMKQSFDCITPITAEQFEMKMRMLGCHASQMTSRRLDMAERRARYWGAEIGCEFAEPLTTILHGNVKP